MAGDELREVHCAVEGEESLRNGLIDRLLLVVAVTSVVTLGFAFCRSADMGWSRRDIGQALIVGSVVLLALIRRRVAPGCKAALLVVMLTVGSLPGVVTLGVLAGTIVLFPTTAAVLATFGSQRLAWWYIALVVLTVGLIGAGFSTGSLGKELVPDTFLESGFHWSVYATCMALACIVSSVTVLFYREAMGRLFNHVAQQRDELANRNAELVKAMNEVKRLSGLLPICSSCKKIRDDKGYWQQIESYVAEHSEADFTHSICPDCMKTLYPEEYAVIHPVGKPNKQP